MRDVVIVAAARTPIGSFQGVLAGLSAPQLGGAAIAASLARTPLNATEVDEVLMGCVLQANLGQAPARQAARHGGLSDHTPCTTINKVCGSGLKAVMLAAQAIALGDAEVVVAGGMESMSNVPYYLPGARAGMRLGHGTVVDGMIHDGLWDAANDLHMGSAADQCAREYAILRTEQDAYAAESYRRAQAASANGRFTAEIAAVTVTPKRGPAVRVEIDEEPARGDIARLPALRPAFSGDGTVTAGNASSLSDGAAAVVLMAKDAAERRGVPILGRIVASSQAAQAPLRFTTAPALAIDRVLKRARLTASDIDLYEINEAFAVVAIINTRLLGLDAARVNVDGGAVALGHPIGASGARVLVTLLHALAARQQRYGCASLCLGGGEAVAMIVER